MKSIKCSIAKKRSNKRKKQNKNVFFLSSEVQNRETFESLHPLVLESSKSTSLHQITICIMVTLEDTALLTNDFQIVWLDNHVDDVERSDHVHRKIDLDHLIDHLKVYEELSQCQKYIDSLDNADKVFLIASGSIGEPMLPLIHQHEQIVCIYIFCIDTYKHQEWGKKFSKIRGIFNEFKPLLERLQRDTQLLLYHFSPVNIFTMHDVKETTLQNIDREHATYMWFQLLIETLLKLPRTAQAHDELIDECIERYRNNAVERRKIEQFATEYKQENVIEWYTRDCFLYRLVNRAFRTRNIEIIFKYRHIIVDLHQRLLELHQEQYLEKKNVEITVYRGQLMSEEELAKVRTKIGGIFSINTFLSTTIHSSVASSFIDDACERPFSERVLYEINIRGHKKYKWPFADVHGISCNTHEGEILFGMGSTFRIDDVYEYTEGLWCIHLTLLDINDPLAGIDTKLYDYIVKNSLNKEEPTLLVLCDFLQQMGEFERAKYFCQLMLRETTDEQQTIYIYVRLALNEFELNNLQEAKSICEKALAMQTNIHERNGGRMGLTSINHLHSHLGLVFSELGDYKKALYHYHQAMLFDKILLRKDNDDRAVGFNNLGIAYKDLGNFKEALYWLERRALKVQLLNLPPNHPDLAATYSNIGETYSENGNYKKARENYERVLAIEKIALPPLHPSTHATFNNLAVMSEKIGDYDTALAYHGQALEVLLHSYSLDHTSFATTYNNMAVIFDFRADFDRALDYYERALKCLKSSVGTENHPEIASTYNNVGMIHYQKKEYPKALEFFEKTQQIEEQLLGLNHSSLATTYNNLGMVFAAQEKLTQAMEYHQRALAIRRRVLSKTHPELAASYDNIGVVYYKRALYKTAIDYHQRALRIQTKSLPKNHPSTATTKEHLGDIYFSLKNHQAALKYYTNALAMVQISLSSSHPSIEQYSMKIRQVQRKLTKS